MSLDFKLMFIFHGCMMVMFMTGSMLTVKREFAIATSVAAALGALSLHNRVKSHWRWPGVRLKDVLMALAGVVFVGIFLFAATPLFPPWTKISLPWYLAGIGIGAFNLLACLKVVTQANIEFIAQCRVADEFGRELDAVSLVPAQKSYVSTWKRMVGATYTTAFLSVWLVFACFFYYHGISYKNGAPIPTATKTEPMTDHGRTVYVTPEEKKRNDTLETGSMIGMPLVILTGFALHFFGVLEFDGNVPTLAKLRGAKAASD